MALTRLQLEDHAAAVLGEAPPDALPLADVVNQAGQMLTDLHPWSWRRRPPVSLSTTAGQSYVALPGDFGSVEALVEASGKTYVRLVSWAALAAYRAQPVYMGGTRVAAVVQAAPSQAGAALPAVRLELHPTPDATEAALTLWYLATWPPLTTAAALAAVPAMFEPILIRLVRAVARDYLDPRGRWVDRELDSAVLQSLKSRDGMTQADLGALPREVPAGGLGVPLVASAYLSAPN